MTKLLGQHSGTALQCLQGNTNTERLGVSGISESSELYLHTL